MQAPTAPAQRRASPLPPWLGERLKQALRILGMPAGSVIFALIVGAIAVAATKGDPLLAYQGLLCGGVGLFCSGDTYGSIPAVLQLSNALVFTIPLIFTGLAVAFAFRGGLFNIGAQGQLTMGAVAAAFLGIKLANVPGFVLLPVVILGGTLAGALYGGLVGVLKAFTGAHEVVTTIMLNYIAFNFLTFLIRGGPLQLTGHSQVSPPIGDGAILPPLVPQKSMLFGQPGIVYQVHTGIFIALLAAVIFWFVMRRTALGYEIRAVGQNQRAARYAGISVKRMIIVTMLISGAFAGLAGAVEIAGLSHNLTIRYATDSTGFDAIAVALLGQTMAIGVVLSALLFAALRVAGPVMQSNAQVSKNLVDVIQALILFSIAANFLRGLKLRLPAPRGATPEQSPVEPGVPAPGEAEAAARIESGGTR